MKKAYACLFAAVVLIGALLVPSAHADAEAAPQTACDLVHEQSVDWTALGETVTFHTRLYDAGEYTPSAIFTMIRADGTEADLGGGGKFIDDWTEGQEPSCQDHLAASFIGPSQYTPATIKNKAPASLSIRDYIAGETVADIMSDTACLANDLDRASLYENQPDRNDEDAYAAFWTKRYAVEQVKTTCREKRQIQKQYAANPELLLHLITINAPILEIRRSVYYATYEAFDPETNKTYELFFSGC